MQTHFRPQIKFVVVIDHASSKQLKLDIDLLIPENFKFQGVFQSYFTIYPYERIFIYAFKNRVHMTNYLIRVSFSHNAH